MRSDASLVPHLRVGHLEPVDVLEGLGMEVFYLLVLFVVQHWVINDATVIQDEMDNRFVNNGQLIFCRSRSV